MNTAAGVARALAEYAWPYSIIVGAAVAAAGAAQIATIASAKKPQAHSGLDYVPQDATYVLKKDEMVLDPGTSDNVRRLAEGAGGMSGTTINVQVGEQTLAKLLLKMSRDGRIQIASKAVV